MEYAKKMVLVPQETLTMLQSARRLEQTPTTRVVHGIDMDMRQLLERQDLTDDQKIKLYHETLQRYMELNRQRMEPLTMILQSENFKSDEPPKLERELFHTPKVKETPFKSPIKMKIPLKEEPEEDEYMDYRDSLPRLPISLQLPSRRKTHVEGKVHPPLRNENGLLIKAHTKHKTIIWQQTSSWSVAPQSQTVDLETFSRKFDAYLPAVRAPWLLKTPNLRMAYLKKVYYDPKQPTYTRHKPIRKRFKRNRVMVNGIDQQWQADLVDMTSLACK